MSDKPTDPSGKNNSNNYNIPTPAEFFGWLGQFVQPIMEAGAQATQQVTQPLNQATSQVAGASPLPLPQFPPMLDPLSSWRTFTQYNEQAWSQFFKQMVSTPEFAAGLGRTTTSQAIVREGVRKASKAYLDAANMPSRDDLSSLAAQVVALDSKLDNVEEMLLDGEVGQVNQLLEAVLARLDNLEQRSLQSSAGPASSSKLENKLDTLSSKLDRLAAIEERLDRLEARLDNRDNASPTPKPPPVRKPARKTAVKTAAEPVASKDQTDNS